jgi:hypothetical protein
MSELKVAILLAGGLRTFWYSIDNILENFIIPNNADVFIYTGAEPYPSSSLPIIIDELDDSKKKKSSMTLTRSNPNIEGKRILIDEENFIKEKLKNYLKDIRFKEDSPEDIKECNDDFNMKVNYFKTSYVVNNTDLIIQKTHYGPQRFVFEQYFKMYKCNEMKNEYALKNNIEYDYVIRLRPDFYYDNIVNLNKLNLERNTLYAPNQYGLHNLKYLVAEWFYFGDNNIMNLMTSGLYKQIYTNSEPHGIEFPGFNGIKPGDYTFVPEAQFSWIIYSNNLNLKLLKIKKKNDYIGNRVEISKDNFIKKYIENDHIYIIYCSIDLNEFIY